MFYPSFKRSLHWRRELNTLKRHSTDIWKGFPNIRKIIIVKLFSILEIGAHRRTPTANLGNEQLHLFSKIVRRSTIFNQEMNQGLIWLGISWSWVSHICSQLKVIQKLKTIETSRRYTTLFNHTVRNSITENVTSWWLRSSCFGQRVYFFFLKTESPRGGVSEIRSWAGQDDSSANISAL